MATTSTKKNANAIISTPVKLLSKKAKKQQETLVTHAHSCDICLEVIVEASENKSGQDAIFCDGKCQTWLHRKCIGLSRSLFLEIVDSSEPFFCSYCKLANEEKKILNLSVVSDSLSKVLCELKCLQVEIGILKEQISSYGNSSQHNINYSPTEQECPRSIKSQSQLQTNSQRPFITNANRKYNIQDSSPGLSRTVRAEQNLQKAIDVLSIANPDTFSSDYISDCHRLGKFSKDSTRSRPLIVKFMRTSDVIQILSNRRNIPSPYYVKPETRAQEALLLKERYSLLQSGFTRDDIKIRNSGLYVKGTLYGKVTTSGFSRVGPDTDTDLSNNLSEASHNSPDSPNH